MKKYIAPDIEKIEYEIEETLLTSQEEPNPSIPIESEDIGPYL